MAGLSGRYAAELLELARNSGQLEAFFTHALVMAGSAQPQPGAPDALAGFVRAVPEDARAAVLAQFIDRARNLLGPAQVALFCPAPLPEPERLAIARRLAEQIGRPVELSVRVDPALVGGVKIVAGGKMVDNTVKKQLSDMKKALYKEVYARHAD